MIASYFSAPLLQFGIIVFLGLVLGSFATALFYRVPRGINWTGIGKGQKKQARSFCPHCEKALKIKDLVPVFSWLLLRGKCRYCNVSIGSSYLLIELMTLLACYGVYLSFGFTIPAFIIFAAVPFFVALIAIDLKHMILPNQLVVILFVVGALYQGWGVYTHALSFQAALLFYLGGALIYGVCAWLLRYMMTILLKKEALGWGDIKFFAVVGLWLGIENFSALLILSGTFGVLLAIIWRKISKSEVFPFGPALIVALYSILVFEGTGLSLTSFFK